MVRYVSFKEYGISTKIYKDIAKLKPQLFETVYSSKHEQSCDQVFTR